MNLVESGLDAAKLSHLDGKVLVVDDEWINVKVMSKMLENIGIECVIAENGSQAIDICKHQDIELVFMDCFMPVMDGYEATRLLREGGFSSEIIALTAYAVKENHERCIAVGMDRFLPKPVRILDVQNIISSINL